MKKGLSKVDKKRIEFLKEKLSKPANDIFEDHLSTEKDGIFHLFKNPCKNQNRFTDNVVLVNIEDLTDEFKEGKLFN